MLNRLGGWLITPRSTWVRYFLATGLGLSALVLNLILHSRVERNLFFISLATVVISSVVAGVGPGLLTTVLTSFGLNYFFLSSSRSMGFESEPDLIRISIFALTGLLMAFIGGALRFSLISAEAATKKAEDAVRAREDFLSIVSHEIKTPLTALGLQNQLMTKVLREPLDFRRQESLRKTLATSEQTLSRAQKILADCWISHALLKESSSWN